MEERFLRILEAGEISIRWVKPLTDPRPNTPFPWQDLDILIVIDPPGFIATSPAGKSWAYGRGDTLVPEPELVRLDPNYPWYHIMSAIQNLHARPEIKRAAICSTKRSDMKWWNELCEEVSRKAQEFTAANTVQNRRFRRTPESLWLTAILPLEAW